MTGHCWEAAICFLPVRGQVEGCPQALGIHGSWGVQGVRCVRVSVMSDDHHNPLSTYWDVERNLQTSVNTHRKVDV